MRLFTLPILGGIFYLTAKLAALRDDPGQRTIRALFAVAGSGLFALLIWFEAPDLCQPVAFIAFAVILSEAGRALRYQALSWHSHLLTGVAMVTALTADPCGLARAAVTGLIRETSASRLSFTKMLSDCAL
jgi:hypothetical protein